MATWVVFGLLVGWLGGHGVLRLMSAVARDMGRRNSWTVGVPRAVTR